MRPSLAFVLISLALLASGCDGNGSGQQASSKPATPGAKSTIWFEPEALSSCETTALVKVHWNVNAGEDVKTVSVFTIRPDGKEATFARHARPTGMKRTGRWIRAGREFVVRDVDRGVDLARAAVGTLPCPTTPKTPGP